MSLWRPIMCRTSQMFPPPPRSDPASAFLNSSTDSLGSAAVNNNNNKSSSNTSTSTQHAKTDPSTPTSTFSTPTTNSEFSKTSLHIFHFSSNLFVRVCVLRLYLTNREICAVGGVYFGISPAAIGVQRLWLSGRRQKSCGASKRGKSTTFHQPQYF